MNEPVDLPPETCRWLLSAGLVGRVALAVGTRPHIVPVNYAVIGDAVVFRTTAYSVLGRHAASSELALEVDHLDYERQRGWSVVAAGRGELVESAAELEAVKGLWDPRPWAGGERLLYVRIPWRELTGRQIGAGPLAADLPVRRTLAWAPSGG